MPTVLPEAMKSVFAHWFVKQIAKHSAMMKALNLRRQKVVLFPPGRCLHMYRDDVGVSCVEVPCTFFNEFDVTRTMIDNHKPLSSTGYCFAMLEHMRVRLGNPHFRFKNDMRNLPPPANR